MNVLQSKVGKIVAGAAAVLLAGGIATASVVVGEQRRVAQAEATEAAYVTSITIRAVEDDADSTERLETRAAAQQAAADVAAAQAAADAQAAAEAEAAQVAAEQATFEGPSDEPEGDPAGWVPSDDPDNRNGGDWDTSGCASGRFETGADGTPVCLG